LFTYT